MKTNGLHKRLTLYYIWSKCKLTKLFVADGRSIWISFKKYQYKWQNKPMTSGLCALQCCKGERFRWNKLHLTTAAEVKEPKDSSMCLQKPTMGSYSASSIQLTLSQPTSLRSILILHSLVTLKTPLWYTSIGLSSQNMIRVPLFPPICYMCCLLDLIILSCQCNCEAPYPMNICIHGPCNKLACLGETNAR